MFGGFLEFAWGKLAVIYLDLGNTIRKNITDIEMWYLNVFNEFDILMYPYRSFLCVFNIYNIYIYIIVLYSYIL